MEKSLASDSVRTAFKEEEDFPEEAPLEATLAGKRYLPTHI
jgi:hypothetical protein